jgi:hypothetical protein
MLLLSFNLFRPTSHNEAVKPVHCFLHVFPNLVPVRSPFGELVGLLRAEDTSKPVAIGDNGRHLFSMTCIYEIDLAEFSQRLEVCEKVLIFQGSDEVEVQVRIRYQLDSTFGVDTLTLEMFAQGGKEPQTDLAIEYVEHRLFRASR